MPPSRRSPTSALWLQLLLVGGLTTLATLVVQTSRAARSGREVAAHALRDYGAFAAWSYREHFIADLRSAVDEMLGPVNHGEGQHTSPRVPDAQRMGHLLRWHPACDCHEPARGPLPLRFYAFVLGSDSLGTAINFQRQGRGWLGDSPTHDAAVTIPVFSFAPDEAQWVNQLFTAGARATDAPTWPYRLFVEGRGDSTRVLATRLMPTEWGDTLVYGFEYSRHAIDSLFGSILARSDLLPASLVRGRRNSDSIDLQVSDAAGRPVFTSRPTAQWEYDDVHVLPNDFGGLRIQAQVQPEIGGGSCSTQRPTCRQRPSTCGRYTRTLLRCRSTRSPAIRRESVRSSRAMRRSPSCNARPVPGALCGGSPSSTGDIASWTVRRALKMAPSHFWPLAQSPPRSQPCETSRGPAWRAI